MERTRADSRHYLGLCWTSHEYGSGFEFPLLRHPLGSRVDVVSARGQFPPARIVTILEWRGKFDCTRRRIDVSAVYGDDVRGEIKMMKKLFANIINKISNVLTQWKNRRLLARINKFYEINGPDPEEIKLLEAHRKSFRKLIKDKW